MSKMRHFFALALAFSMTVAPVWAFNTSHKRQELDQVAHDLNQALGHPAAGVERRASPRVEPAAEDGRRATPVIDSGAVPAEALVVAMNREREAYGLRPLKLNAQLSLAAGDRIHDMFAKHYFNHVSPDGIDPFTWADKRGYDYTEIGENLAVGYRTAGSVVNGWMHSPKHRANILKGDFDEIGIATAFGSPTRRFSGPTVVALYGTRG